jgi:hypothetical protein
MKGSESTFIRADPRREVQKNRGSGSQRETAAQRERRPATASMWCCGKHPQHLHHTSRPASRQQHSPARRRKTPEKTSFFAGWAGYALEVIGAADVRSRFAIFATRKLSLAVA